MGLFLFCAGRWLDLAIYRNQWHQTIWCRSSRSSSWLISSWFLSVLPQLNHWEEGDNLSHCDLFGISNQKMTTSLFYSSEVLFAAATLDFHNRSLSNYWSRGGKILENKFQETADSLEYKRLGILLFLEAASCDFWSQCRVQMAMEAVTSLCNFGQVQQSLLILTFSSTYGEVNVLFSASLIMKIWDANQLTQLPGNNFGGRVNEGKWKTYVIDFVTFIFKIFTVSIIFINNYVSMNNYKI